MAKKNVKAPDEAQIHYNEQQQAMGDAHNQQLLELLNPQYKFQFETRKRLSRYEVLDLHNAISDFYSLKFVKLDPGEVDKNPIFKKSRAILESEESLEGQETREEERKIDREMSDTIMVDWQSPNEN